MNTDEIITIVLGALCEVDCTHDMRYRARIIMIEQEIALSDDGDGYLSYAYIAPGQDESKRYKKTVFKYLRDKLGLSGINEGELHKTASNIIRQLWPLTNGPTMEVEYVDGVEIRAAYRNEIGGESCMSGNDSCYTGLYCNDHNRDRIKLAIFRFDNGRTGRALIWRAKDEHGATVSVMDRIYCRPPGGSRHNSPDLEMIISDWAAKQELPQPYSDTSYGRFIIDDIQIDDNKCPYLDTFYFVREEEEGIYTMSTGYRSGFVEHRTQNGNLPGGCACINCSATIYNAEDNARHAGDDGPYCDDCFNEMFFYCEDCHFDCARDELNCDADGNTFCDSCRDRHYFTCSDCGELHHITAGQYEIEDSGDVLCQSCFENGDYGDCYICGTYHTIDSLTAVNNECLCDDCRDEKCEQCETCLDWFVRPGMVQIDVAWYCPDCVPTVEPSEEPEQITVENAEQTGVK